MQESSRKKDSRDGRRDSRYRVVVLLVVLDDDDDDGGGGIEEATGVEK